MQRRSVAGSRALREAGYGGARRRGSVSRTNASVREPWMAKLAEVCACVLPNGPRSRTSRRTTLLRLLAAVPPPPNRTEDRLLRRALARLVAVSCAANCSDTRCLAMAEAIAHDVLNEGASPRAALPGWDSRVSSLVGKPKGPQLASVIVRRSLFKSVDLHALAMEFRCSDRLVRMAFGQAYGISPRTYRRRTKVLRAIVLLRKESWDNDTVARDVGFRSPKNLYRALRVDTGLTPRGIRRLSEEDLRTLCAKLAPIAVASGFRGPIGLPQSEWITRRDEPGAETRRG